MAITKERPITDFSGELFKLDDSTQREMTVRAIKPTAHYENATQPIKDLIELLSPEQTRRFLMNFRGELSLRQILKETLIPSKDDKNNTD